jgi:hypothetical protein
MPTNGTTGRMAAPVTQTTPIAVPLAHSYITMKHTFSLLLLLLSINLSAQIRGTVFDKTTEKPVQYANVFIKDQMIGATSDLNGTFIINQATRQSILIVSAIGYDSQVIIPKDDNIKIELIPRIYELPEIKVTPKKRTTKLIVDSNKKALVTTAISPMGYYPWIVTKYFNFFPNYNSTPILKQIQIMTVCHLDSAIFNLRLIAADDKGEPGSDLLSNNMIITVKKGDKNVTVNLADFRIFFPKNGFFVAIEWLILDRNKDLNKQEQRFHYDPMFGIVPKADNGDIWMYSKGKWYKSRLISSPTKSLSGELAVELTLAN